MCQVAPSSWLQVHGRDASKRCFSEDTDVNYKSHKLDAVSLDVSIQGDWRLNELAPSWKENRQNIQPIRRRKMKWIRRRKRDASQLTSG